MDGGFRDLAPLLSEDFDLDETSLYELGHALPGGEFTDRLIGDTAMLISAGREIPLDVLVELEARGVIVDEFKLFIEDVAETGFSVH